MNMIFLYRPLDTHLYITQCQGFKQGQELVYLFNMTFYKLVLSAYLQFGNLKAILEDVGFFWSKHDNAQFYNILCNLYIRVYIDNIKAFCPDNVTILILKTHLQSKSQIERHKKYHLVSWNKNQLY